MKIIYPGTFDPITNGHVDLIKRAAKIFAGVIVAVADSARKTPYFSLQERLQICNEALADIAGVTVVDFPGLLVDFAKAMDVKLILRGLRGISDFDYEFQQAGMNREMAYEIETVFLPATQETLHISGTMVREIVDLGGDVSPFVPETVAKRLTNSNSR